MQDVRLNLVKEGSSWKIDVPESIDAQQLNQRLQQQLQMAADHKDRWPADANDAARAISHHVFAALGSESSAGAGAGASGGTGTAGGTGTGTDAAGTSK
jgi:hypothetical protein